MSRQKKARARLSAPPTTYLQFGWVLAAAGIMCTAHVLRAARMRLYLQYASTTIYNHIRLDDC